MKILYNKIKELVPELKASPEEVGEFFTMTGLMMDSLEEVKIDGEKDFLIGLEVRQNRPDCLSYIGLAYELSAYYNLEIKLPEVKELELTGEGLDIKVKADDNVKRILAIQVNDVQNQESPGWLQGFLACYEINSVNLLVDLSNYVMILTGYTSHLLDTKKITGGLIWRVNDGERKINTLDSTELVLKGGELVIEDDKHILALAGIVGCDVAAINLESKNIIAEMAVYDRFIVQQNSRSLSTVTEASNRLSKDMDPNSTEYAFKLLINLMVEHGKGSIASQLYSHYPRVRAAESVEFNPELPGIYAGIEISKQRVREILENLRFTVEDSDDNFLVTAPIDRMDIFLDVDLVEEVIRMNRYDMIPSDIIPKLEVTNDITPNLYWLKEEIKNIITPLGYDEILSQPLVAEEINKNTNYLSLDKVVTQNSVNDEYPDLRQSIASGLINQLTEYLKKNIQHINIFEIGKVFGRSGKDISEIESLGIMSHGNGGINKFKDVAENILRSLGVASINYLEAEVKPKSANHHSCWDIQINGDQDNIGIIYKLKPQEKKKNTYFCEINLSKLIEALNQDVVSTVEITKKIVVLDANIEIKEDELSKYIEKIRKKIDSKNVWSIEVSDVYQLKDENKVRYTIRVSYKELTDQEAKEIHSKVFDLK